MSSISTNNGTILYNQNASYACLGVEPNVTAESTCLGRLGWSQTLSISFLPQCTPLLPYVVSNATFSQGNGSSILASDYCFLNHGLSLPWIQSEMDIRQISGVVKRSNLSGVAGGAPLAVPLGNHIQRFIWKKKLNLWDSVKLHISLLGTDHEILTLWIRESNYTDAISFKSAWHSVLQSNASGIWLANEPFYSSDNNCSYLTRDATGLWGLMVDSCLLPKRLISSSIVFVCGLSHNTGKHYIYIFFRYCLLWTDYIWLVFCMGYSVNHSNHYPLLEFEIFLGCQGPPPMQDQVSQLTNGHAVQDSNFSFGTNATYDCPCGHVRQGFAKRVVQSASQCFGILGWHPAEVSACVQGIWFHTICYIMKCINLFRNLH